MRSFTKQRRAKPGKTKSQIKDQIVLGCQEHKVFLTGYNPNPYKKDRLHQLLKDKIPGYMNVVLPKMVYKGFAFIDVKSEEYVREALEMGSIMLEGHKMLLKEFKQGRDLKKERMYMNEKKVFIHQIPKNWNLKQLRSIFSQFGPLEEIYMCFKKSEDPNDIESVSSKIGFAIYKEKKTAEMIYSKGSVLYKDVVLKVKRVEDRAGLFDEAQFHSQGKFMKREPFGAQSSLAGRYQPSKKSSASRCFSQASQLLASTKMGTIKETANSTDIKPESPTPQNQTEQAPRKEITEEQEQSATDRPMLASSGEKSYQPLNKSDCSSLIKQGFEQMFTKLGISDFQFDEFMKFTAFQYLQSKKIMMLKKQSELLMASSGPAEQQLAPALETERVKQVGKANDEINNGVSKIEAFRREIEFHSLRPTTGCYHSLFAEKGNVLDHKFRNIRTNKSTRRQLRKKNRRRGRVENDGEDE